MRVLVLDCARAVRLGFHLRARSGWLSGLIDTVAAMARSHA
jgi:hypothetical protein